MTESARPSTSIKVVKSASLLLGLQVIQRGLGIVSTLILARLLTPEYFGIVALVTIALQFFELLVETGNQQYIVQKDTLENDDLNTAWTMDVLAKTIIAVLVILCAPAIAHYFETPELTLALSVAALALPIRALKTPGMMRLVREINYRPLFMLTLWQKVLSFTVVVTFALIRPDYWAIIAGNLVAALVLAIGSYRVDAFRPRWTLVRLGEQWKFSQWLLLRSIVGFTRSQIDNLMVSKLFGTTQLGGYNLVRDVSLLPALSAIIPMSEPLLAAIAEGRNDSRILANRIRLSLALLMSLLTPVTTFIMLYPELIIRVLLGEQWQAYAHLLQPFGLFFFTFCLFALISDAVIAQGRVKALFVFDALSVIVIVVALLLFGTGDLTSMAWTRGWLAVGTTIALLLVLNHLSPFNLARLAWLCVPTVLASLLAGWLATLPQLTALDMLPQFLIRGSLFVVAATGATWAIAAALLRNSPEWLQLSSLFDHLRHPSLGNSETTSE